ncbi:MAG TPA: PQQ-binding-like beta-propeller repeat protein [Tepidisphaeraceae bacterium]|nr:PQQ-binding-like beta-propeller repeat protein [Tepidisphaeraceae bacterium]
MKWIVIGMIVAFLPLQVRAAAPVRAGIVVIDAAQFLAELPDGDTATNGLGGGGRGRGRGGATATAPAIVRPAFTFENFTINLRAATPFSASANIPRAGTWHLYVRSRSMTEGSSFKVSVDNTLSAQTFGDSTAGTLKYGGAFQLQSGPLKITLTEIHPGSSIDGVFLSPNAELTESDLPALQYPDDIVLLKEYLLPVQIDGVKFGDLNGDGKYDLVVLTPNYSTFAFDYSGKELWHYDAPQAGTVQRSEFEAPGNVWDFDQDGKAEVIAWRMIEGKEYLTMADGMTGEIKYKVEWPTQPLPHVYNNFRTAIAHLHPGYPDSLIVYTDSGGTVSVNAYGPTLNLLWSYSHPRLKDYHGHYIYPNDINGDGIDEVYVSHVMLDANGHEIWNNYDKFPDNHDHVDSARFVDLDGDGRLEIVAGQSDVGTVIYDALTGKLLWQRFANHNQKIEAGNYRSDVLGPQVVASSRFYVGGLGALLRWYDINGNRLGIWPNNPIPGNPNFVKGDFKGEGKNMLFWQRFRIEPDGRGTLAFPEEAFHMFDFLGIGNDQVITVGRGGIVRIYGYKGVENHAPAPSKIDPVYRAHSISNHTHY